jgi:hypothetical protein
MTAAPHPSPASCILHPASFLAGAGGWHPAWLVLVLVLVACFKTAVPLQLAAGGEQPRCRRCNSSMVAKIQA